MSTCNRNRNRRSNSNERGSFSNKIRNSGFERSISCDSDNNNWRTNGCVERTCTPSLVHTGRFAALLFEDSSLEQKICRVSPNSQYEFSFFAKTGKRKKDDSCSDNSWERRSNDSFSDDSCEREDELGLEATVTFVTNNSRCVESKICIEPGSLGDNFGFYRTITPVTPCNIVAIIVCFRTIDSESRRHESRRSSVSIDDVSLNRLC